MKKFKFSYLSALILNWFLISNFSVAHANSSEKILGSQKTAVVLLDLANDGKEQASDDFRKAIFDSEFSIDHFVQELSYGKASLSGQVFGWIPVAGRAGLCEPTTKQSFAFAGNNIPYEKFDRVIFLHHVNAEHCAGAGLGESDFGKHWVKTPRGKLLLSVASLQADNRFVKPVFPFQELSGITSGVIAHELGHSFGIYGHGNILDCGAKSIANQRRGSNEQCTQSAIADRMSGMGGEGFSRPALQWSACHKEDLGWLDAEEMITVPSTVLTHEPMKIKLYPYASGTTKNGPVAVKIVLDQAIWVKAQVPITALYIEYRTAIGFDRRLKEFGSDPLSFFKNLQKAKAVPGERVKLDAEGLQVRGGFFNHGNCTTTYLLDAHPNSLNYNGADYSLYDALDSNLRSGETMDEPNNEFRIEAGSVANDGSIEVSLIKTNRP